MLTAFVVFQLLLDVLLVLCLAVGVLRRAAPPATPPDWYREMVALSQDMLLATEPMLDALERREAPALVPAAAVTPPETERGRTTTASTLKSERHRQAFALLHAGARDEEVIRASGIASWELKLIKNILATERS